MKTLLLLLLAVVAVCSAAAAQIQGDDLDAIWEMFKKVHSKRYHCRWEEEKRKIIFQENIAKIHKHNLEYDLGLRTFTMGVNEYSDMSANEFSRTMNGLRYNSSASRFAKPFLDTDCDVDSLPTSVDWRTKGFVTPVKNQGQCGSCYAFSSTGSLEGQMFKKTGKLVSLSEKNIIDCSRKEGNEGCNGGTMDNSFLYIKNNKGIDTEGSYPYHAFAGKCRFKKENVGGEDVAAVDLPRTEKCLQKAVATIGPISVGIYASPRFEGYRDGIFRDTACLKTNPNHGVLVVGYGTTKRGVDYWLVKNSWGKSWGIDGYIKMARNNHDMCGIAYLASYPVV